MKGGHGVSGEAGDGRHERRGLFASALPGRFGAARRVERDAIDSDERFDGVAKLGSS
jgi:hypothetical protein